MTLKVTVEVSRGSPTKAVRVSSTMEGDPKYLQNAILHNGEKFEGYLYTGLKFHLEEIDIEE